MATMKAVAEYAEVSVATVSRVINKTGYVSPDLEERVTAAMRQLKYQPSALARSLRRQQTQTIGVLLPQLDHPFFSALAFAIEKRLFQHEYRTLICSSEESQDKENTYAEILLQQRVDGVIIVPTGKSVHSLRQLTEKNVPVVLIDRDLPEFRMSKVLVSNFQGGYDGMAHLLALGHRVVGVIGAPAHSLVMQQRIEGIQKAATEQGGVEVTVSLGADRALLFEMGYEKALELLQRTPRPTAIFALTDVMAIGVLHAAAEMGIRIPDELSVMGFDDIPLASYSVPALTSVAQPIYKMGEVATQVLLTQIQNREAAVDTHVLPTELIIRQTTAQAPAR